MNDSYKRIERSWASQPVFYEAPYPLGGDYVPSPYQHAGVEYRIQRDHGVFGDAPGLGKTAECILTSNAFEAKRTLVLCPASLRLNWEREIWMWSTIENVSTYPVLASRDGISLQHDYVILSYDALRNDGLYYAILEGMWDHVIFDEAHYLKDPKGNVRTTRTMGGSRLEKVAGDRAKQMMYYEGILSRCGAVTMATGTPMPNQPIEVYNMARLMDWDSIGRVSQEGFREYYYSEGWGFKIGWYEATLPDGEKVEKHGRHRALVRNVPRRMEELQAAMRSSWLVRRLKEHVLTQLPEKQFHLLPIEANADIRKAMKHEGWRKAEKLYEFDPAGFDTSTPIDGSVSTARRLVGEAKAPRAVEYCKQLLDEGVEKLVVSAWHRSVLKVLREGLSKYGIVYMDGSTSATAKQNAVDDFQTNPGTRVILGQQQPLGLGWTLTAAQDVVFAEFDWVPGVNDQLLDRIHRRGQTGSHVTGHIPFVPGSLEEKILGRAVEKGRVIHAALDKDDHYNPEGMK